MNAAELLITDHQVIRGLLHQLEGSSTDQAALCSQLLDERLTTLNIHTQIENDLFYPAIRNVSPLFAFAHAEHHQIDDQLAVVFRSDPASDDFSVEVTMLAATIDHHASEEEHEMFPSPTPSARTPWPPSATACKCVASTYGTPPSPEPGCRSNEQPYATSNLRRRAPPSGTARARVMGTARRGLSRKVALSRPKTGPTSR